MTFGQPQPVTSNGPVCDAAFDVSSSITDRPHVWTCTVRVSRSVNLLLAVQP
ncbi:unnamed protein product [Protopolystoma xenopodis]|uniref:Uncharacterized protein n=1 Tax=Protopolystoma xenopodis TaxID=117903 RepID=A0A3S5B5D0_9PLAT|nr:unnamed protein product [Protopolystoma xenopodis]